MSKNVKELKDWSDPDHKTVRIKNETHDKLKAMGKLTETFDDVINRLITQAKENSIRPRSGTAPDELIVNS